VQSFLSIPLYYTLLLLSEKGKNFFKKDADDIAAGESTDNNKRGEKTKDNKGQ